MKDETREIPAVPPASQWDTVANWGRTGEVPRPPEYARPWVDAGPPPGTHQKKRVGWPAWAVLAAVVGLVMFLCVTGTVIVNAMAPAEEPLRGPVSATGGATSPEPEETTTGKLKAEPARTTDAPKAEPEKPAPNRVGKAVRVGDFQYVVHGMKCGISRVGSSFLEKRAQGSFCRVDVTIKNVTKKAHTFHADTRLKAHDSAGREFSPDGEAGIYGNKESAGFLDEINPGNQVRAFVYFDVPKGAKLVRLELSAGVFTLADDAVVELG